MRHGEGAPARELPERTLARGRRSSAREQPAVRGELHRARSRTEAGRLVRRERPARHGQDHVAAGSGGDDRRAPGSGDGTAELAGGGVRRSSRPASRQASAQAASARAEPAWPRDRRRLVEQRCGREREPGDAGERGDRCGVARHRSLLRGPGRARDGRARMGTRRRPARQLGQSPRLRFALLVRRARRRLRRALRRRLSHAPDPCGLHGAGLALGEGRVRDGLDDQGHHSCRARGAGRAAGPAGASCRCLAPRRECARRRGRRARGYRGEPARDERRAGPRRRRARRGAAAQAHPSRVLASSAGDRVHARTSAASVACA